MWQIADKQNGLIPDGFEYGTYKVEDVNNDGKYTADKDRKIIGYSDPAYRFSIRTYSATKLGIQIHDQFRTRRKELLIRTAGQRPCQSG